MGWLDELKAGDEVVAFVNGSDRAGRLLKVDRTTATQIIVGNARYRRSDGRQPGSGYGGGWIVEVTPERREIANQYRLCGTIRHRMGRLPFNALPAALWAEILALLPPPDDRTG